MRKNEKRKEKSKKFKGKKDVKKVKTFFLFLFFFFFAFHFQETTETFKGVYQNGNFYWEKPQILPGNIWKSDFAPLKIFSVTPLFCSQMIKPLQF